MFYTPFLHSTKQHFIERLEKLKPDTPRQWGSLTPVEMLAHLTFTFEMGSGKHDIRDESTLFTRTFIRFLTCHFLHGFPGGRVKFDPMFTPPPEGDLDDERTRLYQAMDRFLDDVESDPIRQIIHPVFGPITLIYSTRVQGIHLDHHLKQFGL